MSKPSSMHAPAAREQHTRTPQVRVQSLSKEDALCIDTSNVPH